MFSRKVREYGQRRTFAISSEGEVFTILAALNYEPGPSARWSSAVKKASLRVKQELRFLPKSS